MNPIVLVAGSNMLGNFFYAATTIFNKVKTFHRMMDERTQEEPIAWDLEGATHRAGFKIEELVEFCPRCKQF